MSSLKFFGLRSLLVYCYYVPKNSHRSSPSRGRKNPVKKEKGKKKNGFIDVANNIYDPNPSYER